MSKLEQALNDLTIILNYLNDINTTTDANNMPVETISPTELPNKDKILASLQTPIQQGLQPNMAIDNLHYKTGELSLNMDFIIAPITCGKDTPNILNKIDEILNNKHIIVNKYSNLISIMTSKFDELFTIDNVGSHIIDVKTVESNINIIYDVEYIKLEKLLCEWDLFKIDKQKIKCKQNDFKKYDLEVLKQNKDSNMQNIFYVKNTFATTITDDIINKIEKQHITQPIVIKNTCTETDKYTDKLNEILLYKTELSQLYEKFKIYRDVFIFIDTILVFCVSDPIYYLQTIIGKKSWII